MTGRRSDPADRDFGTVPEKCLVRLIGPPQADGEYVALRDLPGGDEVIVHLHDYSRLYETAGLYEQIVQELLGCCSPEVAASGLSHAIDALGIERDHLRLLDLGAGTGLVGALVRDLGVGVVIGVDALPAARAACLRDRPGTYCDYLVGDLADPAPDLIARIQRLRPGGLIAAGSLGGTHAPASALLCALDMLPIGSPVVFTVDERWTRIDGDGGFRSAIAELVGSCRLVILERSRFQHRVTTTGAPVYYELIVGALGAPVNDRSTRHG